MSVDLNSPAVLPDGALLLPEWGVILAEGADAATFLHGQLTQDLLLLPDGQARLAAYCSAKGRVLASLVVVRRSASELWLLCRRELLATTLKRLSMFVLRAKVKLSDATETHPVWGLSGQLALVAGLAPEPWSGHAQDESHALRLYPAGPTARALWVGPRPALAEAPALPPVLWHWGEVISGIAWVGAAQADAFVPQMLNYESVGGVNFKKGCYPGQEVVARSQFRGTLKRRLYRGQSSGPVAPGAEVFVAAGSSDSCGVVVDAAPAPHGGYAVALVLQVAEAGHALALGAPDGPALALGELPYPLLTDL